jgi:hypothetical protein
LANPYRLPAATVLAIRSELEVVTTTIEIDQCSYLSYPIAPASLRSLDSNVAVFDFHQLIRRDGARLTFETYLAVTPPPPIGSRHLFCRWWASHAMAAVRDLAARWELRPYPGDGHNHCLLTWTKISAIGEETEGYFNDDYGWISKQAFRDFIAEDRLRIRGAWLSIEAPD